MDGVEFESVPLPPQMQKQQAAKSAAAKQMESPTVRAETVSILTSDERENDDGDADADADADADVDEDEDEDEDAEFARAIAMSLEASRPQSVVAHATAHLQRHENAVIPKPTLQQLKTNTESTEATRVSAISLQQQYGHEVTNHLVLAKGRNTIEDTTSGSRTAVATVSDDADLDLDDEGIDLEDDAQHGDDGARPDSAESVTPARRPLVDGGAATGNADSRGAGGFLLGTSDSDDDTENIDMEHVTLQPPSLAVGARDVSAGSSKHTAGASIATPSVAGNTDMSRAAGGFLPGTSDSDDDTENIDMVHVTLQPPLLAVGSRDASAGVDVAGANATNDSTQMMVPESSGEVGPDSAYNDNEGDTLVQQLEPQVERSQQQQQQQQQQQRKAQPDLDKISNTASPRLDSTELSSDATAAVGAIGAALAGGTDSLNAFSATLDAEADKLAAAQRRSLRDADGTIDAQMLDETKDLLVSALCDSGISFNSG